ncbi:DsbA family protein [Succinimonas sp.]|uniref:DsbA family protein n=1 Tax=Succinimonas sp. TaxID=1936151 RepID=UPI00386798F0
MKLRSLVLTLTAAMTMAGFGAAAAAEFSAAQKAEIESIVHDYLLNNPDIMLEVGDKLKARQEKLQEAQREKAVKEILANPNIPQSGAEKPKHTIIEFFDYNCGYCKQAKPHTMKVLEKHKDVRYYYLEFPILTEVSYHAARVGVAIYAMNPELYVKYNNDLMTRKARLQNEAEIQAEVEALGLKWAEVAALSKSAAVSDVLSQIRTLADQMQVTGTPSFIIDGVPMHGAPRSVETVESYFK